MKSGHTLESVQVKAARSARGGGVDGPSGMKTSLLERQNMSSRRLMKASEQHERVLSKHFLHPCFREWILPQSCAALSYFLQLAKSGKLITVTLKITNKR